MIFPKGSGNKRIFGNFYEGIIILNSRTILQGFIGKRGSGKFSQGGWKARPRSRFNLGGGQALIEKLGELSPPICITLKKRIPRPRIVGWYSDRQNPS
jgi:hypothetical protein